MSSPTLTCRCRFCGYVLCYRKEEVGADVRCPQCGQDIRLAGKLSSIATIISRRQIDPLGIALEVAGFVCMFVSFPWGALVGAPLVYAGWRKARVRLCSGCGARLAARSIEQCPACHSKFGSE